MLPKRSHIKHISIDAFDYHAIIVYFTVREPGTLYVTWYYPSYERAEREQHDGLP